MGIGGLNARKRGEQDDGEAYELALNFLVLYDVVPGAKMTEQAMGESKMSTQGVKLKRDLINDWKATKGFEISEPVDSSGGARPGAATADTNRSWGLGAERHRSAVMIRI